MTEEERQLTLRWIACWRRAGPELERIRAEEIRATDTGRSIQILDDAFESAIRLNPPRPTSGLIEQQRFFAKARP